MNNELAQIVQPVQKDFLVHAEKEVWKKEVAFAMQQMTDNPYLLKCTKESIQRAVLNVALTRLTLNPTLKYAYLIPRKVRGVLTCVLDPTYQGLSKLVTDTGSVTSIKTKVVYEGDKFEWDEAEENPLIVHRQHYTIGNEQGKILCVYSIATLPDGSKHSEIMSKKQIYDRRETSESYKNYKAKTAKGEYAKSPWIEWEADMFLKTIIKHHTKYLPKTDRWEHLSKAIDIDNEDHNLPSDFSQILKIEGLVTTVELTFQQMQNIENKCQDCTKREADEIIRELQAVGQRQINKKMLDLGLVIGDDFELNGDTFRLMSASLYGIKMVKYNNDGSLSKQVRNLNPDDYQKVKLLNIN